MRRSILLCSAFVLAAAFAVGCVAKSREWKTGEEVGAFALGKAIITAEGRIIMEGQDHGPYGPSDVARIEKDRSGKVRLLVNDVERSPTGVPLPKSLALPEE